jgi:beta-aspartyl-dipeptidase (metallo-type)
MLTLIKNGEVFLGKEFEKVDLVFGGKTILQIGKFDEALAVQAGLEVTIVDCKDCYVCPGFIDSQICLVGGSGEDGFLSQPPRILIEECVRGGITTAIGSIGVDTSTKTMGNLLACVKAFKEAGLTSLCYTGGYDTPIKPLNESVRTDLIYIEEIIGAGEVAIADRRVPEPYKHFLARTIVDAYVGGILTGKAGVTRIHVGEGRRRLQTIRDVAEHNEIQFDKLYFTHIERSKELIKEGIEFAKLGSFLDFDLHDRDLEIWYKEYQEAGGPLGQLSFSSDAGICSPEELWLEIKKCALKHNLEFKNLLPHVTEVPARALKLKQKGALKIGNDADIFIMTKKDLDIKHLICNGKFFIKDENLIRTDVAHTSRRKMDWYGFKKD